MSSVNFELTKPFKYASKDSGGEVEANFIELREPTGKQSHLCCQIESLIQSGLMKMADVLDKDTIEQAKEAAQDAKDAKGDDDGQSGPDAESVLSIMSSGGANMIDVVGYFRQLFREVAWMGGEKLITVPRMDDMSHKDFRRMMGEYASNFILN